MEPLQPPQSHYLSAAIGWLELGRPEEARAELEALPAEFQRHPDVLEARWLLEAGEQRWEEALRAARTLIEVAPERPSGWLHQAYALRRTATGGLQAAWDALRPSVERFPKEPIIPFNLACYACQMGRLEAARQWLGRAFAIGDKAHLRALALADADLQPLWEEIRNA